MSAEAEMDKEEVKQLPAKLTAKDVVKFWPWGIKILELLISALCLGLIYEPASTTGLGRNFGNSQSLHHIGIMYTTYTGFMVINCVLLISKATKKKIPYVTIAIFALTGAALSMITCIILFMDRLILVKQYFYQPNMYQLVMLNTAIYCTFVNVMVYGADAILTLIKKDF